MVAVILALPIWAAEPQSGATATIQGRITDTKGKPIQGAVIITEPPTTQVVSRSDGSYAIPNVPAGTYSITAKTRDKQVGVARVHVVTAAANVASGVEIRLRGGETLQEKWLERRNAAFTSLAMFPAATLVGLAIAEDRFDESANEARRQFDRAFPTSPGDFLIRAELWEEFQKLQTREDWMRVTSWHLLLDALPFYWYSVRGKRLGDKSLILYYGSQAIWFGTWAAIDWDRASDAERLAEAYAERIQFHEATEQQGKKGGLGERAKWLAVNAALDVASGYLYWKIIPQSTDRRYAHLRWAPQYGEQGIGISVSGTFRFRP
jgi:hypothetical protein